MGIVYGAGGLWNWKLTSDEMGWSDWANSNVSWKEAIMLPGAVYVGYLGKALEGVDVTDIELHPELAGGHLCLAKPGELYILYLPEGGNVNLSGLSDEMNFRWFNPVSGKFEEEGIVNPSGEFVNSHLNDPMVLIVKTAAD